LQASEPSFPSSGINRYVTRYIRGLGDLSGKVVVDLPAGDGRSSWLFAQAGAKVRALDLFPEFMRAPGLRGEHGDMGRRLPLEDACADYALCQEGIEHVSDQLSLLGEFNRILKPGGRLILTTPNSSHLRARLAHFCFESDTTRRMPPTEVDSIWFDSSNDERIYFGHLFLLGVNRLLTFARLAGFALERRLRTDLSPTSLMVLPLGCPAILGVSTLAYLRSRSRFESVPPAIRRAIFWEHVRVNCAPSTLLCKHIFWVLRKQRDLAENRRMLKAMTRETQQTG
jgi:SAM-dependent methyltransferase